MSLGTVWSYIVMGELGPVVTASKFSKALAGISVMRLFDTFLEFEDT